MLSTSEKGISPLCFTCLTFFLSLGGFLSALMRRAAALGTTSTCATRFWIVNWTVIFRPFHACEALAISSPIFLGDRPRGPTLGANEDVAPTSPPIARSFTILISVGSNLGGMAAGAAGGSRVSYL